MGSIAKKIELSPDPAVRVARLEATLEEVARAWLAETRRADALERELGAARSELKVYDQERKLFGPPLENAAYLIIAGDLVKAHEAWSIPAIVRRVKADEGRKAQAASELAHWIATFRERVWPRLAPLYGASAWKVEALRLCGEAGISVSERVLERYIARARSAGVPIPRLRPGPKRRR